MVGYHQTSVRFAQQIIESNFQPSSTGMLGPGIYFAINYNATEGKAKNKGACFVALINLGRVEEISVRPIERNPPIQDGYDSKYYHHENGPENDEFVIRNAYQILRYVVVVDKQMAQLYWDGQV